MAEIGAPLLIRADAGSSIGMGHVMRCLALAQGWREKGGDVSFVMTSEVKSFSSRLASSGIGCEIIETAPGSGEDADRTLQLARRQKTAWIVVDGYRFGSAYQQAIKNSGLSLLFIDDYAHVDRYAADIVLNQNLYAESSMYPSRESYTKLLLGSKYVLLRKGFLKYRSWKRELSGRSSKILVTLGGTDPKNGTEKVAGALQRLAINGTEVVIVMGEGNSAGLGRASLSSHSGLRIDYRSGVQDMENLMQWADLAVSGGGSTCWEMAFMGLPNLVLVMAENQHPIARALDSAGISINLGAIEDCTDEQIESALNRLIGSKKIRAAMSRKGRQLVDGGGVARVIRTLISAGGS